ncbi:MAG: hypothetical protein COB14_09060 [Alphaproteobacteria bacterium]|nr:MAG: hypothetical protein COB14_09060 [Alphaproteobacteria bacterium]
MESPIKILFLTTQTTHHTYFIQEIRKQWSDCRAVLEKTGATPPFEVGHSSDILRDQYEIEHCLNGKNTQISELVETVDVNNINDTKTLTVIQNWDPDIIIDFGTRRVCKEIIAFKPDRIVNLHGGNPEEYRGLDSHLWAIYHNDFSGLVTTLHTLNQELDDGGIIDIMPIPLFKGMKTHQFRRYNTEVCIQMVLSMLRTLENGAGINIQPQKNKGRYYSFMPTVLKNISVQKFERYMAKIDE